MEKITTKKTTGAKKTQKRQRKPLKTVDQLTFARMIAHKFELTVTAVLDIILEEQKLTMRYVNDGYKVIKKNYLTIESKEYAGKTWVSPLDKKVYTVKDRKRVLIRVGEGFKNYINNNEKKDDKLCRFVATQETEKDLGKYVEIT
ncbi:MAG: hypothetical protein ACI4SH_08190 [Candidatus Scatosoma sp.]